MNNYISDKELGKYIGMYEKALNHYFKDYPKQPSIYSHERQEYSGLDINTYIYIADNYYHLKKKTGGAQCKKQNTK